MLNIFFTGKNTEYKKYMELLKTAEGKIVCFDLDNVLANVNKELKKLGCDVSHYPASGIEDEFWLTEQGMKILLDAEPMQNTLNVAVSFASVGAAVAIATKRDVRLHEVTQIWFSRNYHRLPNIFFPLNRLPQIMFLGNKLEAEADIYVEDNPAEIAELLKAGKIVLAPEWPYNKSLQHNNLIHFKS